MTEEKQPADNNQPQEPKPPPQQPAQQQYPQPPQYQQAAGGQPLQQPAQQQYPQPPQYQQAAGGQPPQQPAKKSKKGCLIGCLVVLVILIIAGVVVGILVSRYSGNLFDWGLSRIIGEDVIDNLPGIGDSTTRQTTTGAQTTSGQTTRITQTPASEDNDGEDIEALPRYPGSVRTDSFKIDMGDYFQQHVSYLSGDSKADIKSFYSDQLEGAGWNEVMSMTINNEVVMSFERKGDELNETATLTLVESAKQEDQVEINLTYQSQKVKKGD